MIRAAFLLLAASAIPSMACEPAIPEGRAVDERVEIGPSCGYEKAASDDRIRQGRGKPAVDIGGGRVGQVHVSGDACGSVEELMVVDCTTAEMISITGLYEEGPYIGGVLSARKLQTVGGGPIALRASITISELARIAADNDFRYVLGPEPYRQVEMRNRVDPYCGCRLYYPQSPGAKQ